MPSWDAAVSEGYHCLAEAPAGAVMDLLPERRQPRLRPDDPRAPDGRHGGGERDLEPPEHRAMREDNDWLGLILRTTDTGFLPAGLKPRAEQLRELGYRYFVVRKQAYAQQDENIAGRRLRKVRKTLAVLLSGRSEDEPDHLRPWLRAASAR